MPSAFQKLRRIVGRSIAPAQYLEANAGAALPDEAQCLGRTVREIDKNAVGLRPLGRPSIQNSHIDSPFVRQICDTDDRSERVCGMCRHHRLHIEPCAAGCRLAVESGSVIRGQTLTNVTNARGRSRSSCTAGNKYDDRKNQDCGFSHRFAAPERATAKPRHAQPQNSRSPISHAPRLRHRRGRRLPRTHDRPPC